MTFVSGIHDLKDHWENLRRKAEDRRQLLEDSHQAQQYFADANEAETWMKEKEPIVSSVDFGRDEDSTEALQKKHEALMQDIVAYKGTIEALREQADDCRLQEAPAVDNLGKEFVVATL